MLLTRPRLTEDLGYGRDTRAARRRLPRKLWSLASRKLDAIDQAGEVGDLRVPPGNRMEALHGDREHSIRINDQHRICFRWTESGPDEVEIVDYH